MTYTIETFDTRQAWLEARRTGIGGSDAAALWRASNWQSPYSVWWSKTAPLEPDDPTIEQRAGKFMEPFIAELFTEITVHRLACYDLTLFRNKERPHLIYSPDGLCWMGRHQGVWDAKKAKFQAAQVWKERVPESYQLQLLHGMAVTGLDFACIAVLLNDSDFKWHRFDRVESQVQRHIEKCGEFWERYVVTGTAPPTDYSDATAKALAAMYPESKPDVVEAPAEFAELGDLYDTHNSRESTAKKHKAEIQNRLKAFMGEHQTAKLPDGSGFTWKGSNGKRRFTRVSEVRDERE